MLETQIITQLTPEQEALILVYRRKWQKIALSTARINCQKAAEVVKAVYAAIGLSKLDVLFFNQLEFQAIATFKVSPNPGEILAEIARKLIQQWEPLTRQLAPSVFQTIETKLIFDDSSELKKQQWLSSESLWCQIWREWLYFVSHKLWDERLFQLWQPLIEQLENFNIFAFWNQLAEFGSYFDYCISVLNCKYDRDRWNLYQSVVHDCGWIFPFPDFCIVGDRPLKLSVDNSLCLHAEGEPAIQFSDGFSVYVNRGVRLAEEYGKLHPR